MKSRLVGLVSAAALAVTIGAVGFMQVASAGEGLAAPLTIVKTVTGTAPAGTTFDVTLQCDDDIIVVTDDDDTDSLVFSYDTTGQPLSPDTVGFSGPGQCTVTETASGGAASTTYACEGVAPVDEPDKESFSAQQVLPEDPICPAAGPQASPIAVNIEFESQTATVTVHNTFGDPAVQPAASIVAAPAFTG